MKKALALFPALLFLGLFLFPSQARADAVVIDSGYLRIADGSTPSYAFAGQGLAVSNSRGGSDFGSVSARRCQPCFSGDTISLNSGWAGELGLGLGAATVNGTAYPVMYYTGRINFAGSAVMPFVDTSADTISLDFAFTFSGQMNGYLNNPIIGNQGPPIFSTMLSGQGIATLQFYTFLNPNGIRQFSWFGTTYNFQPAPTPEPTTLLLLGTGLAGLAARARKRRARK